MKNILVIASIIMAGLLLTGCLFPNDQRVENQIPYPDQLQSVQQAVNQYKVDHGVLPIKTRDMDTPIYHKYPIDFSMLVPRYIQQPPGNSFEHGGVFQYVLVNVEDTPEVKLIDLTVMNEVRELQSKIIRYQQRNEGLAPIDEMVDTGLFTLNFEKLNYREPPRIQSPFFDNYLPLLIDNSGQVLIDYKMDLNMALIQFEHDYEYGDDIRNILVENSPFVPVFSIPYTVGEDKEPVYFMDRVYGRE